MSPVNQSSVQIYSYVCEPTTMGFQSTPTQSPVNQHHANSITNQLLQHLSIIPNHTPIVAYIHHTPFMQMAKLSLECVLTFYFFF